MTQLQLFMTLQEGATPVQVARQPQRVEHVQNAQMAPNHSNSALLIVSAEPRATVPEKFLLHGGDMNSPVLSLSLLRSHDSIRFLYGVLQ